MPRPSTISIFFFLNDTATPEIYTLPLHDALPISCLRATRGSTSSMRQAARATRQRPQLGQNPRRLPEKGTKRSKGQDRKSTRLNSSHSQISYAVFCLKKKKQTHSAQTTYHDMMLP